MCACGLACDSVWPPPELEPHLSVSRSPVAFQGPVASDPDPVSGQTVQDSLFILESSSPHTAQLPGVRECGPCPPSEFAGLSSLPTLVSFSVALRGCGCFSETVIVPCRTAHWPDTYSTTPDFPVLGQTFRTLVLNEENSFLLTLC